MTHKILGLLFLMLVNTSTVFAIEEQPSSNATDNATVDSYSSGFVELGYRLGTTIGSNAKANEYNQHNDGPAASTHVDWRKGLSDVSVDAQFSGDTSGESLTDSQTGSFDFNAIFRKSDLFSIEAFAERFGHNLSDGLTNKKDVNDYVYATNSSVTNDFTYNRQRTHTGIKTEVSLATPFFASVKVDNLAVEGLMPLYGVSNGNVPYPVDYDVNTMSGELGYRSALMTALVTASVDALENNVDDLRASRTSAGVLSGATKKPIEESASYRLGGALTYRIPALQSTAMFNGSFSQLSADELTSRTSGNTAATSWDSYESDIKTTALNGALSSLLWKGATSKLYGRYYQRDNDSEIEYNETWLKTATATTLLQTNARDQMAFYEYEKELLGAELNQRLGDFKLQGGLEWETTDRNAYGLTQVKNTEDLDIWGQVKAQLTETVSAHIRYGYLDRTSADMDDVTNRTVVTPSSGVIASWFSYMDTASKQSQSIKSGVEWNPTEKLNISLDYVLTQDDYNSDAPLGLENGMKHGGIADISYSVGPAQFHLYGSIEQGETQMNTRVYRGTTTTYIGTANPYQADTTSAFNWSYTEYDTTYTLGTGATVDLIKDKLTFQLFYDFSQNDGDTNLDIPAASGVVREDIEAVNDYTLHNLNAKLTYLFTAKHSVSLGYTFSKLNYKDWSYNDSVTDAQKLTDGYYDVDLSYETHVAGLFYRYTF